MARNIRILLLISFLSLSSQSIYSQKITYSGSWGDEGYTVESATASEIVINFSIEELELMDVELDGISHQRVLLPGHFLSNAEGAPDLPGGSRYILVPEGAEAELEIIGTRTESLQGINVMPSPKVPMDIDEGPMVYQKDSLIYNANAFYPQSPVILQTGLKLRGMSVALLGIMPFQYNPVSKELLIYRDLQVRISFTGGTGEFGVERYRIRQWDAILKSQLLNASSLPEINYSNRYTTGNRTVGCEYLIICPDDAEFQQWADSIKKFRTEQGILTEVRTITEVGGNTESAIETYIDDAYNTWDTPPSAVLLLGDHGTDPANSITSVILDDHPGGYNPYVSDNIYADVDGDNLPDIAFARITARNAAELELMVHKFMDYERNPPTSPDFYDHPITALGWQTTRWFQICSETIGGYLKNIQGKDPVRINEVYTSSPPSNPDVDPWSTAPNTTTVLNYFGSSGLGYIPASPTDLGGWTGGSATDVNNAINSGSFLLQHRDHGAYWGWGEPYYTTSNISGLTNTDLTFIMSINCQTGQFDISTETFTEKFHRYQYNGSASGALGLIAATQISYSFVNDVYIWGLYDYMWPDFMPTYGSNPAPGGLLPCFGNVAGKYHLEQSSWPYNTGSKVITYKLFHHHGDAYLTLYSEVPQGLTVSHSNFILPGQPTFTVTADPDAFIALTFNGQILGTEVSGGGPVNVPVSGTLIPGEKMVVTITKTNYYRYRAEVTIQSPTGPFVAYAGCDINDASRVVNGQLDAGESSLLSVGLQNIGALQAEGISAVLRSYDSFVQITDSLASYGNIPTGDTVTVVDGFQVQASDSLPDGHQLNFEIIASDGSDSWTDYFSIVGHAPVPVMMAHEIDDSGGNGNAFFDPGETVDLYLFVRNAGSTEALNSVVDLSCSDPYVTIGSPTVNFGDILPGDTASQAFTVTADPFTPPAQSVTFDVVITTDNSLSTEDSIEIVIGMKPALVLDLDPNTTSGPAMVTAMQSSGVDPDYYTTFPADLSAYQSIFCCLGVYASNHVLSSSEGDLLADYLDNGGNLYMEGADTWAYDAQTSVHPMFNISPISDGSGDMATVNGISATFADGLSYNYSGENSYMDRLAAASPAVTVLQNSSPVYGTCVAYDQGSYRTIGASHEFGGLDDGTSTKAQLMAQYLMFFGVAVTCEWDGITSDWSDPGNWSNGIVPGPETNVFIPFVPGNPYPIQFSGGSADCKSITVEPGANFALPAGVTLTVHQ